MAYWFENIRFLGTKAYVVIDGNEGKQYNGIGGDIVFDSPDTLHYLAENVISMVLVEETIK